MSVAPGTNGPIAPPIELCLDLGIAPKACVVQESAERLHNAATLRKKGSLYSDQKKGKWPHEWGSLAEFDAWHQQEELVYSIELIGSSVHHENEPWLDKHLYVCSHQLTGSQKIYQKKYPKWQCMLRVVVTCYNTACGLQLCFLFFFHVSPFPPHVACRPRA